MPEVTIINLVLDTTQVPEEQMDLKALLLRTLEEVRGADVIDSACTTVYYTVEEP